MDFTTYNDMNKLSEEEFIQKLLDKDKKLLTWLYVSCKGIVYNEIFNFTKNVYILDTIEEFYDDAFVLFIEKINKSKPFKRKNSVCSFLKKTAKNKILNQIKSKSHKENNETQFIYDISKGISMREDTSELEMIERDNELLKLIIAKIKELDKLCKKIIMYRFMGIALKDIASIIDKSYDNTRKVSSNCIKEIKEYFNSSDYGTK